MARATRIVGIGGSTRPGSLTEQLVRGVMAQFPEAERLVFAGPDLDFPFYGNKQSDAGARRFVESVAEADALVVGSPGYHGTMSGLVLGPPGGSELSDACVPRREGGRMCSHCSGVAGRREHPHRVASNYQCAAWVVHAVWTGAQRCRWGIHEV
jgi:hypothetical protein